MRFAGEIPRDALKYAYVTRDEWNDSRSRVGTELELNPPWPRDKLHAMIVHAALATGHRLPTEVIEDYPDVVQALSDTVGMYLHEDPGILPWNEGSAR